MNKKNKPVLYVCKPFRGKCTQFKYPKKECAHAVPHDPSIIAQLTSQKFYDSCIDYRDGICGGKCFKITKGK